MEQYIGTKIVDAELMRLVSAEKILGREIKPGNEDGYLVEYEDGYKSWSPKDAFEKAYRRTENITFGLAIEAMKKGYKVARKGWNRVKFLYYVSADKYPAKMDTIKGYFPNDEVPYGAYIAIKTAQGNVVPWIASQSDILAEDWYIAE